MPVDYHQIAHAVLARPPRLGNTRLVCVDGPSGAGKTTVAQRIAAGLAQLSGLNAPIVATDDLLDGWADQFSFWSRLEDEVLAPIAAGRVASYRPYDWVAGHFRDDPVTVPVTGLLIVEGVTAARPAIHAHTTLTVFVTAPAVVRHARALARDGEALRPQLERWWRAEDAYFTDEATDAADVVIASA